MHELKLPKEIESLIGSMPYKLDTIGMSDSQVFIFDSYVLKISKQSDETDNEYRLSSFLSGKVPVPEIQAYEVVDGIAYTLMTKAQGVMLCDPSCMCDPMLVSAVAAEALHLLWKTDISGCPDGVSRLENRLKRAGEIVSEGLVDMDNLEADTFGPKGFKNPEALLDWLWDNRPDEDLVLTHGDFCLPNLFVLDGHFSSFIDIGKMGPADRWQDVSICLRSLYDNYYGVHKGNRNYPPYDERRFFSMLEIPYDAEKRRYYKFLDELF